MNRRLLLAALAAFLLLLPATPAAAATFNGYGYSVFSFGSRETFASPGVAALPGQGALLSLSVGDEGDQLMGVTRIDRRGRPVRSFGRRGLATAHPGSGLLEDPTAMLRQADGRIVVVGGSGGELNTEGNPRAAFGVARFTAAGDAAGVARYSPEDGDGIPNFVLPRPGGGLVLGGRGSHGDFFATPKACVVGLDAALAVDPAYRASCLEAPGISGLVYVDAVGQPDGSLVAAVSAFRADGDRESLFGIARLLADGSVDTAYGNGGFSFVRVDPSACDGIVPDARRIAPRAGGGWIVGGGAGCGVGLAAFTATGAPDTSFGQNGIVTADLDPAPGAEIMTGLTALSDGGFATVAARDGSPKDLLLARWRGDGTADPTFDRDGRLRLRVARKLGGYALRFAAGIMPRGNGLLVTYSVMAGNDDKLAVLVLKRSGKLDRGFGLAGVRIGG